MAYVVTGDDIKHPITLKKDGATFAIAPSATVQVALVSLDHETLLAGPSTCSASAPGADWPNSLIIATIASEDTLPIAEYGPANFEIQVDDGGKLTWFVPVEIIKGHIP